MAPPSSSNNSVVSAQAWACLAAASAWLLLIIGCGASLITVAHGTYRGLLLTALTCAIGAAILLFFAIRRGGIVARFFALLAVAPLIFIISDFLSRF